MSTASSSSCRCRRALDAGEVIDTIDPDKDVDGLHPISQGRLVSGMPGLRSCTPLGVMRLIDTTGVELKGARAVVVGRSNLVGKPVAFLLLERHATLTICHSRTRDLAGEVRAADVLIAAHRPAAASSRATGSSPARVVIDVGTNRTAEGKLVGDVDFAAASERAARITPVPGGVGPMTIAMLLKNTVAGGRARARRGREPHAALRRPPRAGGAHGRLRRLGDAGAVQRHHRRAHRGAHARRAVRRQPHGRDRAARPRRARRLPARHRQRRAPPARRHRPVLAAARSAAAASSTTSSSTASPPSA